MGQAKVGRFIQWLPRILGTAAQLVSNRCYDCVVEVDRDAERHCNLLPFHGHRD